MKSLFIIPILITLLTGCGVIDKPQEDPRNYGIAVDVISENKQDIEYIKNRTADDIELGYKAREAVISDDFTDEELGAFIRKTAKEQPTMPKAEPQQEKPVESPLWWVKWVFIVMIVVIVVNGIVGIVSRRKNKNG